MKIALIRRTYTPFGGAERYMSRLVDGLAAEGHALHILAVKWEGPQTPGIIFHPVPVCKKPGWLSALTFSRGCSSIIDQQGFDVVFSLERTMRQDIYRAGDGCHRQWLALKNRTNPLARLITWLNPFQQAYLALERHMLRDSSLQAIVANSMQGKDDIIRLYGVDPSRIHVVYNGIDPVICEPEERERSRRALETEFGVSTELRLLYVGSGFSRKGVATAIKAAAQLSIPFRLFVIGKGRSRNYRVLAQRLGIGERVVFTGPRHDVEIFYQGCDLFVFPTLYDPFSNATLEAMAHGLPVITSRYNGVAELIEQGSNGFVIEDPRDAAAIAGHIRQLGDPVTRSEIGRCAAETAAPFTMQRNVRETLAVINSVVSHRINRQSVKE
jgi:UDP-glucose:(heptosyl)LPS alpha-1,3-glucosyltransferase